MQVLGKAAAEDIVHDTSMAICLMFCEYAEVCADANKVDTNRVCNMKEHIYEPTLSNCTTIKVQ